MFHVIPSAKPNSVPSQKHLLSVKIPKGQTWQAAGTGNRLPWQFLVLPTIHRDCYSRTVQQQSPPCLHIRATAQNNLLPLLGVLQISTEIDHHLITQTEFQEVTHLLILLHNCGKLNQKHFTPTTTAVLRSYSDNYSENYSKNWVSAPQPSESTCYKACDSTPTLLSPGKQKEDLNLNLIFPSFDKTNSYIK